MSVVSNKTPRLGLTNEQINAELDKLAEFRKSVEPIPSSKNPNGGTLARLDIGDEEIFGISGHRQKVTVNANNFQFGHAETDALQQAFNTGINAERATIFVDNQLCRYCSRRDGLPAIMQDLGLKELIVHDPVNSWIIKPGVKATKVPRTQ